MNQPPALKEFAQALFITPLTGRLSMPQATAGSKAAQVPARCPPQATAVERYLVVEGLKLPAAGQTEDSMVEGGGKNGITANNRRIIIIPTIYGGRNNV
jgi:hypothetical protein